MRHRIHLASMAIVFCSVTAAAADPLLERGAYLVEGPAACGNCHTPQGPAGPVEGMALAGGLVIEEPGAFIVHTPSCGPPAKRGP